MATLRARAEQSLLDLVLEATGSLAALPVVLELNPGISLSAPLTTGQLVEVPGQLSRQASNQPGGAPLRAANGQSSAASSTPAYPSSLLNGGGTLLLPAPSAEQPATHMVRAGQSLPDIATEVYGSLEGVAWLLEDNPVLSASSAPVTGLKLTLRAALNNSGLEAQIQQLLLQRSPLKLATGQPVHESAGGSAFDEGFDEGFE